MQSSRGGKPRGPGRRKTLPNPLTTTGLPTDTPDNLAGSTTPLQSPKHSTGASRTPQAASQDRRGSRPKSRPPSSSLSEAQKPFNNTTAAATTTVPTATMTPTPALAAKKRARSEFLEGTAEEQPDDSNQKGGHSLRKRARVDYSFEYVVDDGVSSRAKALPTMSSTRGRKKRIDADDGSIGTPSKRRAGGGVDGSPRRKAAPRKTEPATSYADTGDDNDVKDTIEVGGRKSQPVEEPESPEVKLEPMTQESTQIGLPSQTQESTEASQPSATHEASVTNGPRTPETFQAHESAFYGYSFTETPRRSRESSQDKSVTGPQPHSTNDSNKEAPRTEPLESLQIATVDVQTHEPITQADDAVIPSKLSDETEPLGQPDTVASPVHMDATAPEHAPPAHSPKHDAAVPEASSALVKTSAPHESGELESPHPPAGAQGSLEGTPHEPEQLVETHHPQAEGLTGENGDRELREEPTLKSRKESPGLAGPAPKPQHPSVSESDGKMPQDAAGPIDSDNDEAFKYFQSLMPAMHGVHEDVYRVMERLANGEEALTESENAVPGDSESESDYADPRQPNSGIGEFGMGTPALSPLAQKPEHEKHAKSAASEVVQDPAEHPSHETEEAVDADEAVPAQSKKEPAEEAPAEGEPAPGAGSPSPEAIAKDSTSPNELPEHPVREGQESPGTRDAIPSPSRDVSASSDLHEGWPTKSEVIEGGEAIETPEAPEESKKIPESGELDEIKEGQAPMPVSANQSGSPMDIDPSDVEMASADHPEADKETVPSSVTHQDLEGGGNRSPSPDSQSSPGLDAEAAILQDGARQIAATEHDVGFTKNGAPEDSTASVDAVNSHEHSVTQDTEDAVAQDAVTRDTVARGAVVQGTANAVLATDDVAHDSVADDQDDMMEEDTVEDLATENAVQDTIPENVTSQATDNVEPVISTQEPAEAAEQTPEDDVIVEPPKPINPWSHLTLYIDGQYTLHPESRLPHGGHLGASINDTGSSTPTIKGAGGEVTNGDDETEVAHDADEDADEPIESSAASPRHDASAMGSPVPELNDATAASSPEALDEDEEAAEAEAEAEVGDETPPEQQGTEAAPRFFKYPQLRDPDEFHDVLQNYKDMSDEDLYEMCAFVASKLVDLQDDYLKLGAIVDDHENVSRRRAHDDANEQLERRGDKVSRKTFVLKGYRTRMTQEEKETAYLRQQDRIQASAYGFRYDAHQSKVGKQDPVAQRPFQDSEDGGSSGPRRTLRSDPSRSAKATEAADEPGVVGAPVGGVVGKRVRKPRELFDPATASRSATPVQVPRRRGRQPKAAVEASEEQDPATSFASSNGVVNGSEPAVAEKPRRGRKRRVTLGELVPTPDVPVEEDVAPPPPKRVRRATNKAQQAAVESNGYSHNHHTIPRTMVTTTSTPEDDAEGEEEEDNTLRRIVTLKTSAKNFRALSNAPSAASTEPHTEAEQDSSRPGTSSSATSDATADSSYSARPKRQRKRGRPAGSGAGASAGAGAGASAAGADGEHEGVQGKAKRARRVTKKAEESTANKTLQLPSIHNRVPGGATNAAATTTAGNGGSGSSPQQHGSAQKPRIKIMNGGGGTNSVFPAAPGPDAHGPAQAQGHQAKGPKKSHAKKAGGAAGSPAAKAQKKMDDALAAAQANMSVKDYAALSKSEKMSHSMKSRWASGSMQQAVDKRKATLAKKKAAKVAAIESAPDSSVGSPVDQNAAATGSASASTSAAVSGLAGDGGTATKAHAPSAPPHQGYSFVLKDVRGPSKGGKGGKGGKAKGSH